ELFLVENEDKLQFFKSHSAFFGLKERIQERATLALRKNLDGLVNEIRETRELYTLLMKATREELSKEERQKVRDQMMDILKTIPALAVFALPFPP
ncbi:MAG: hypothetical protein IH956_05805, partial [Chloroflexi bacterium]|nr:hypothetical protein [Chloroflexota bacterium]